MTTASWTPDDNSRGFLTKPADPLRYDGQPNEPDEVAGVLSSLIPRGARVLDVGCGTGSVSAHVAANTGAEIVGVEPDPARAFRARSRGFEVHTELLTEALVDRLGLFDVVMFADVLEHLSDPLGLLRVAATALAPGGGIVASVPNVAHWSVRSDILRGRFEYRETGIMDATHLRWFTHDGIALLFKTAGFRIEQERMTHGVDLQCYADRWPWRRMSRDRRVVWVRKAVQRWPRLFGCQLVVRAVAAT